ncbi:MAG: AbrB/MazE/SpoVT family DNA-binding domain-containing protein [Proteobacteria bacterium]|nr:AbrB/MazE/SpoVT family DNA-binding domain-containing protein [Pseudomonadota bacterium]
MTTVTVSSKYQIVIPRAIRESLGIRGGMRLHALEFRGRLELVPVKSARDARGFLRGIDTTVPRDKDKI